MLIPIDLPQEDIESLDRLAEANQSSRAELVHRAIASFIARHRSRLLRAERDDSSLDAAFGIWKGTQVDGQEYQDQIRSEWDRERGR